MWKKMLQSLGELLSNRPRGSYCEICGRPGDLAWGMPGIKEVVLNSKDLAPDDDFKCVECGRYYCSSHDESGLTCVCGSKRFRTMRMPTMS